MVLCSNTLPVSGILSLSGNSKTVVAQHFCAAYASHPSQHITDTFTKKFPNEQINFKSELPGAPSLKSRFCDFRVGIPTDNVLLTRHRDSSQYPVDSRLVPRTFRLEPVHHLNIHA